MNEKTRKKLKAFLITIGIIVVIVVAVFIGENQKLEQTLLVNDSLVSYKEATIVELNNELENANKAKEILDAEFSELKIDNKKLESKLIVIKHTLKKVQQEKDKLQKDSILFAEKIDELQSLILDYQGSKEYLEKVVVARNDEIELLRSRNTELERKVEEKEKEIFKLKQIVKGLEKDKKRINTALEKKEKEIEKLIEEMKQIGNKNSKKAREYQAKIDSLIQDTAKLNDTINTKDSIITDLDNKVPRLYNFRAYYYKEIKQRRPGRIVRKKMLQKDYLDSKMDYAKYVKDIHFKFNINTDEFFKSENDKLITIELHTNSGILKQQISLSKDTNMYDAKIFTNLNLQEGNFTIKISYDEGGIKIEKHEFKLI